MTDYYTQACFHVPCSPETARAALDIYQTYKDVFKDWEDTRLAGDLDQWLRLTDFNAEDRPESIKNMTDAQINEILLSIGCNDQDTLDLVIESNASRSGISISGDETIDVDQAANLTQWILCQDKSDDVVIIEFSNSASRPVLDAFGGGCIVVSRHEMAHMNTINFGIKMHKLLSSRVDMLDAQETYDSLKKHIEEFESECGPSL